MKQEVVVSKKGGLVYSIDKDFLVGLVIHNFDGDFPDEGVKIYYDLDDLNACPYRLYKRSNRTYFIE